ncbi:MAG TPA: ATPase, partial [Candidatus Saccharimonadales bacterium]
MTDDLFEAVIEYPNDWSGKEYDALVGLDDTKESLNEEAGLMLNPELISQWSKKLYNRDIALTSVFRTRPPLFLFSGDVGTGKTALAESFAGR